MTPARCYECNDFCEYIDTKYSRTRLCYCPSCRITWEEIITEIPRPIKKDSQPVDPIMESRDPLVVSVKGVIPR